MNHLKHKDKSFVPGFPLNRFFSLMTFTSCRRVDKASATETVRSDSIPGRAQAKDYDNL